MHIQRPVFRLRPQVPDPVEQDLSGQHIPFVADQEQQELILLVGQGDLLPPDIDLMPLGQDQEVAASVFLDLLGSAGRTPAQEGADTGQQLHHAKGLGDIIVRSGIQALHPVVLRAPGREHDDRKELCRPPLPDSPQDADPVLLRQHDIEQQQVRDPPVQGIPESGGQAESLYREPLALQRIGDQLPDTVVIFQNIDQWHGLRPPDC